MEAKPGIYLDPVSSIYAQPGTGLYDEITIYDTIPIDILFNSQYKQVI